MNGHIIGMSLSPDHRFAFMWKVWTFDLNIHISLQISLCE
jgi:hypothetical protein